MRVSIKRVSFLFCAVSCLMSLWSVSAFGAERPRERNGPIERLDDRYHHGHYYVPRGTVVRELPTGYRPYWFHGTHLYFSGGVWYAPGPYGFMVTRPPPGLVVSPLPPFYTTVWIGGVPYYYANDVYYRWVPEQNGYEVVESPQGAKLLSQKFGQSGATGSSVQANAPSKGFYSIFVTSTNTPPHNQTPKYKVSVSYIAPQLL